MSERKWTDPCKCTFHQKMAGDGCDLCNPDRAKELKEEDGVMSERREGWYWVKYSGRWQCAEWSADLWKLAYGDADDEMLDCIDSRIPTPDEPWQCVPKEPTEAMLIAEPKRCHVAYQEHMEDIYSAMLSAAPKPEDD